MGGDWRVNGVIPGVKGNAHRDGVINGLGEWGREDMGEVNGRVRKGRWGTS